MVRTIPDGVRLDSANQQGLRLTLEGVAESNAKVSAYLRSLESSAWMRAADLSLTQAEGEGRRNIYKFKLEVLVGPAFTASRAVCRLPPMVSFQAER